MLKDVEVSDFAIVDSLDLLIVLGSIGNVISVYDLKMLAEEGKSRDES